MVVVRVYFGLWPIQFDKLNKMLLTTRIRNSLCAFHMICTIFKITNNFPSTLQDSTIGKHVLLIIKIPSNLLIPLVSIPLTVVPSWNRHINNYVYSVSHGFQLNKLLNFSFINFISNNDLNNF